MGNHRFFELVNQVQAMFNSKLYPLVNVYIAMENGPVEIVDFPIKNGGSFHCYVSSPEGNRLLEGIAAFFGDTGREFGTDTLAVEIPEIPSIWKHTKNGDLWSHKWH